MRQEEDGLEKSLSGSPDSRSEAGSDSGRSTSTPTSRRSRVSRFGVSPASVAPPAAAAAVLPPPPVADPERGRSLTPSSTHSRSTTPKGTPKSVSFSNPLKRVRPRFSVPGFEIVPAEARGACLFHSILMALQDLHAAEPDHPCHAQTIADFRQEVVDYMRANPAVYRARVAVQLVNLIEGDQLATTAEPLTSQLKLLRDARRTKSSQAEAQALVDGYTRGVGWEHYLDALSLDHAWGGDPELGAIQDKFALRITLHYAPALGRPDITLGSDGSEIHLLFWGDHYDMLRPRTLAAELAPSSSSSTESSGSHPLSSPTLSSMGSDSLGDGSAKPGLARARVFSLSRKASVASRGVGSRHLSKYEFAAYSSTINEECPYTALYESIIRYFTQFMDHPIHLVPNSLAFKADVARQISEHPDYYLDELLTEVVKAIRSNQVEIYSGTFKASLLNLVKTHALDALLRNKATEEDAYKHITSFLKEGAGIAQYTAWIAISGASLNETALRAAAELYSINLLIYHGEKLYCSAIANPSFPILYFQKDSKRYLQLVSKAEEAQKLILPFFANEPAKEGFSPHKPRYLSGETIRKKPRTIEFSKAGRALGARLYEMAVRSIQKRDIEGLKTLVIDASSPAQMARKMLILDHRKKQDYLPVESHRELLIEQRRQLELFINGKRPEAGKFLTFCELRAQLEFEAELIISATAKAFEGRELSDRVKELLGPYTEISESYRVHEYVPQRDKDFFDAERRKPAMQGPVAAYAAHVAGMAKTVDSDELKLKVNLEISEELGHLDETIRRYESELEKLFAALGSTVPKKSEGELKDIEHRIWMLNALKNFLPKRAELIINYTKPLDKSAWTEVKGVKSPAIIQAWSTPLTLEEVRARFGQYLDTFADRLCSTYKASLRFHPEWLDHTEEGFILRSKDDADNMDKRVAQYRESISRQLEPIYQEMSAWQFGADELPMEERMALAKGALARVERAIDELNKILAKEAEEDPELEHLRKKYGDMTEEADVLTQRRLAILLGKEACAIVYGPDPSNSRKLGAYNEMTDAEILAQFYPEASIEELAYLLEKGLSPDACDSQRRSLLHLALAGGSYDEALLKIVEYLLNCMASVDLIDNMRRSPAALTSADKEHLHEKGLGNSADRRQYDLASRALELCTQAHLRGLYDHDYRLIGSLFTSASVGVLKSYDETVEARKRGWYSSLLYSPKMAEARALERAKLAEATDRILVSPHEALSLVPGMQALIDEAPKGWLTRLGLSKGGRLHTSSGAVISHFADSLAFCKVIITSVKVKRDFLNRLHGEVRNPGSVDNLAWQSEVAKLKEENERIRAQAEEARARDRDRFEALEAMIARLAVGGVVPSAVSSVAGGAGVSLEAPAMGGAGAPSELPEDGSDRVLRR